MVRLVAPGFGAAGGLVEGDAELDLDVPPGDADFLDEESEQGLFLLEVETIDAGADAFGEVVHTAAHLVVAGEFLAL